MTPVEALAVLITGLTSVVVLYALRNMRSQDKYASEWPFSVLGIRPTESVEEVKRTYRELVKKYHPDRLPENASPQVKRLYEERLIQLNNAYKTIMSLREQSAKEFKVDREELKAVLQFVERAESAAEARENPKDVAVLSYQAAEKIVDVLCRAAGLSPRSQHFYDKLTELMIGDCLTVEEFEALAEFRRLSQARDGKEISLKEAVAAVRKIRDIYNKILERHVRAGNG